MANYSFDDDSRVAGTVSLATLGTLAPGESALIIEGPDAAFRTQWALDPSRQDPVRKYGQPRPQRRDQHLRRRHARRPAHVRRSDVSRHDPHAQGSPAPRRRASRSARTTSASGSCRRLAMGSGRRPRRRGDIGSPGTTTLGECGPVSIVGGNGTGNPNTLPCNPEPASNTGPATAGAQTWPGGASVDGCRSGMRLEDDDGARRPRHERLGVRPHRTRSCCGR